MIDDLDKGLEKLLIAEMKPKVNISFEQPTDKTSKNFSSPTLNLFLFDVRENNVLRQHRWQVASNGNGRSAKGDMKQRSPYRFDCHYLLTAWASTIEDEHRMLSKAMHVLLQHPVLPKEALVGSLEKPQFPIQARLGSHDKLTNPAELWSALDNQIRAAVSYIVTIELNPWEEKLEAPPVHTKRLRLRQRHLPDTAVETVEVAGTISSADDLPADLVAVLHNEQWWYEAAVDGVNGRYRLNHVLPGDYTLTVWQAQASGRRRIKERRVTVLPPVDVLALADTFSLRIGSHIDLPDLHLVRRRSGYVGQVRIDNFSVSDVGKQMPLSGRYYFGQEEKGITAVIPTRIKDEPSFHLRYTQADKDTGNYDLTI